MQAHWVSEALKNVRSSNVTKCFMKAGFPPSHEPEDDPDDDLPLADLILRVRDHLLEAISDPQEYVLIGIPSME